jgi:hypothetical protein
MKSQGVKTPVVVVVVCKHVTETHRHRVRSCLVKIFSVALTDSIEHEVYSHYDFNVDLYMAKIKMIRDNLGPTKNVELRLALTTAAISVQKLVAMTSHDLAHHGKKQQREDAKNHDLFGSYITPALRVLQKSSIAKEGIFKTKLWSATEESQNFAK